jgi:hypothetical protein
MSKHTFKRLGADQNIKMYIDVKMSETKMEFDYYVLIT